jgi:hypothetical protein
MATNKAKRLVTLKEKNLTVIPAIVAIINLLLCVCLADVSDTFFPNGTYLCFNKNDTDLLTAGILYR